MCCCGGISKVFEKLLSESCLGFYNISINKKTNEKINGKKKIKGYIGYYGLEDWWNKEFSKEEQKYMIKKYQPMSSSGDSLTTTDLGSIEDRMEDTINLSDELLNELLILQHSVVKFLTILSGWFNNKSGWHLAEKIINKANELSESSDKESTKSNEFEYAIRVLDKHFLQSQSITTYYKKRENPAYLDKAIKACNKQIELAEEAIKAFNVVYPHDDFMPGHTGFKQLAIILEKQKKYDEAIKLCLKAKKQGWGGDWDKRIERCSKKLNKA